MTLVQYEPQRRDWIDLMVPVAELAKQIANTEFVKPQLRGNPAAIAACIMYGDELGFPPMYSLQQIAVIQGNPSLSAEGLRAKILQDGHSIWIEESTITRVTVAGRRRDSDETSRVTWTMDDAKRAGLAGKPNWRAYPRQMLLARASAELARAVFADAVGGLRATEELEDVVEGTPEANGSPPEGQKTRRRKRSATSTAVATVSAGEAGGVPATPAAPPLPGEEEPEQPDPPPEPTPPPPEPEPPLPGEPDEPFQEPLASSPQRRMMFALFREHEMTDREERLKYAAHVIGRPLQTSTELTASEAGHIIDALEAGEFLGDED